MKTMTLPGLSKYLFREDGEVVSLWHREAKVLAGGTDKDGYRKFVLIDDLGARRYVRRASLICAAFHGPRERGMEVRHLDGSRQNDAADNLEWSTHAENCSDKLWHGTAQRGEKNGNSKFTEEQIMQVKHLLRTGMSQKEIASVTETSRATVSNVKYGKVWAWL